jgi:hypothetical protein
VEATSEITSPLTFLFHYQQHRLQGFGYHAFFLVWTDASIVQETEQVVLGRPHTGMRQDMWHDVCDMTQKKGAQLKRMRVWKPPHTGLSHDADVSFMLQTRAARLGMVLFRVVKTQTSVLKEQHQYIKIFSSLDDVMSSTREDVIRRRHVLFRCTDSSLNHEWSKIASFVSCLDACLNAVGVRLPLSSNASSLY